MYYAKLSIPGKNNSELSYIFVDELSEQKSSSVVLFGLFDVSSTSELYHTIIKESVKHFLDFYHTGNPLDSMASDDLPDSREFVFENSIQYTYEKVSDTLRELQERSSHRQAIELKKINCLLGALIDDTLFLSLTGSAIYPFLVYPVSHRKGPVQTMLMNIAENSGGKPGEAHARLFSTIVSGSVAIPASTLIFCNQTFVDYISPQQIKQTVSNVTIDAIIPYFEHLLTRVHAQNDFSALVIARDASGNASPRTRRQSTASSVSMEGLNGTATSTQSIMAPSMGPYLLRALRTLGKGMSDLLRSIERVGGQVSQYLTAPRQRQRYRLLATVSKRFFKNVGAHLPRMGSHIRHAFQRSITSIRDGSFKDQGLRTLHSCALWFSHTVTTARDWFRDQNPISRSLFVLSALFIILFITSIVSMQIKGSIQQREARVQEILSAIEQKLLSADAGLIYDDRPRARELIAQSEQLLTLIDERFRNHKSVSEKKRAIEEMRLKVNNVVTVEASELASLQTEDTGPLSLTAYEGMLIISTSDTIYLYDRAKKQLAELAVHEKIPRIGCAGARTEQEVFFCSQDGSRLYALSVTDSTIRSGSLNGIGNAAPSRILFYGDRLYSFSRQSGILYRHNRSGDGYGPGQPWVRQSIDMLKGARDVAIDGLVYVLTNDGSLLVMRSGKRASTEIPRETRDILKGAQRIIASSDLEYLYALDPSLKRIVVIDKRAFTPVAQITSSALEHPQDFAVSKKRKTILILDGKKLLSLPYEVK